MAMIDITAPDSAGFGPLLGLAKFPNVYVRTSLHNPSKSHQTPYRDVWPFLRRLYDTFGPRRLIWANFFEYIIMKELIPFFTAEDKEWILGRTAHRIYGFDRSTQTTRGSEVKLNSPQRIYRTASITRPLTSVSRKSRP